MAENLIKLHNKVLESHYGTFEDVKYNMERYDNLMSGIKTTDSQVIDIFVKELESLLSILRTQEDAFSSLMNCSNAEEAIKELNTKIDKWNTLGGSILLELETRNQVLNLMIERIDDAAVIELLQDYVGLHQKEFDAIVEQEVQPTIEEALTALFDNKHRFNKNSTLGATLMITKKSGRYTVSTSGGNTNLSQSIKKHLLTLIKESTDNTTVSKQAIERADEILRTQGKPNNITEEIINLLGNLGVTSSAMKYIRPEIENTGGYARYANLFVIQGYLGEVYWNAFMHYLFEDKAWIIPVGDVKNIKGKSMAIDMLVNDIGFQIKRWSIKEGIEGEESFFYHTNKVGSQFGTFLSSRAQLLESEVGEIIARMFGSLSYNKPNEQRNPGKIYEGQDKSYNELFKDLVTTEKINFSDLEMLFQTRLSSIIGISGTGGLTLSGKQYYNTFWAINDRIVPSSAIIEELISDIRAMKHSQGVSFTITKLQEKDSNAPLWPRVAQFDDLSMANRWQIAYETQFNLTKLLERAAQKA